MACVGRRSSGGSFSRSRRRPPSRCSVSLTAACGVFAPSISVREVQGHGARSRARRDACCRSGRIRSDGAMVGRLPADARQVGFWFGRRRRPRRSPWWPTSRPRSTLKPLSPCPTSTATWSIEGRLEERRRRLLRRLRQPGPIRRQEMPGRSVGEASQLPRQLPDGRRRPDRLDPDRLRGAAFGAGAADRAGAGAARRAASRWSTRRPPTRRRGWSPTPPRSRRRCWSALNATRVAGRACRRCGSPKTQSATAARVARQYFAAALGPKRDGDGALVAAGALDDINTIALGLLAGWQVAGTIRDGTFVSVLVPQHPRRGPLGRLPRCRCRSAATR